MNNIHSKKLKEGSHLQDLHVDGRMRYLTKKEVWRGVEMWLRQCQDEMQLIEPVSALCLDIRVYQQGKGRGGGFYLVVEFLNQDSVSYSWSAGILH